MPARAFTVNCSILLTEVPLLDRPQAARDAGFEAVEFWWPFDTATPADHDVDRFVRALTDAGVTLSGLNFAAGDLSAGERGLLSDPATATMFRDSVDIAVGIGAAAGTSGFNALYGHRVDTLSPQEQDQVAVENLDYAAQRASSIGADVLIEPLSGFASYPIRTVGDAVAVVEQVGAPTIYALADLYHLAVNGEDIPTTIDAHAASIGHVQIAGAPGRHEPDTGTVDLLDCLERLISRGYGGYVSAEYIRSRDDTFGWLFAPDSRYRALTRTNGGQHHTRDS